MKNIISILLGALLFFSSCSDLLDTVPKDLLIRETFWKSEADVEASMIGVYNELQGAIDQMIIWGESRSGYIAYKGAESTISTFNRQDITDTNPNVSWGSFYQIINFANTIIKFAPNAAIQDDQYTQEALNNHLGEAYYIRALMHFYMIRSFIKIPYIDFAYDNDTEDFYRELSSREEVFTKIVADLITARDLMKRNYDEGYNSKGRASKDAVQATLADTYLWMGEYQKALDACDAIKGYNLVENEEWFNLFFEGNNEEESIFEIQFSEKFRDYMPESVWTDLFLKTNLESRNLLWPELENSVDSRVLSTVVKNGDKSTSPMKLWKWVGIRSDGEYIEDKRVVKDCNWILYRYADVVLMKAEALNNLGNGKRALKELNLIRKRAEVSQYDTETPVGQELDELILDERGRELAFEGKRWFDLVRFSLRYGSLEDKNSVGNKILIDRIILQKAESGMSGFFLRYKIRDPRSWFLPIYHNELTANPKLRQFEYYDRTI